MYRHENICNYVHTDRYLALQISITPRYIYTPCTVLMHRAGLLGFIGSSFM